MDIKKYSFKQGLPQEFELIRIGQLYHEHTKTLTSPHRTGFYHILWFQEGSPKHMVDFNPIEIRPNSILFLPKDTVQRFDKNGNFDGKAILFTESFFCRTELDSKYLRSTILFNNLFSVSQVQLSKSTNTIRDLFQQIETELANEIDQFQSDILKNLLHNLLLISERESKQSGFKEIRKGPDFDYILLFKDILENQYKTQKQVSSFALKLGITEKRLNLATSRVFGKTPKQIIDERIMLEAKRLLAHTNESIKEIGFVLGFEEPTNFIKYFRKHQKATPVEFRELYQLI